MANETARARVSLELALVAAAHAAANDPKGRSSALRDVLLTLECLRELGTVTHREQLEREEEAERARLRVLSNGPSTEPVAVCQWCELPDCPGATEDLPSACCPALETEPDVVKAETLRSRILRWVRDEPRSISRAYDEFLGCTERETREELDLLVEQGWLVIGDDMKLYPTRLPCG